MHPTQIKIMEALTENPDLTFGQLQEEADVSSSSVIDYHLKALMANGFLKRGNRYEVNPVWLAARQ